MLLEIEPHRDGCHGDHRSTTAFLVDDIESALDDIHCHRSVRQAGADLCGIDHLRLLHADRHFDLHCPGIDIEASEKRQRTVMDAILHGAECGFGVVAAMHIIAMAHFEDDALQGHYFFSGMSR